MPNSGPAAAAVETVPDRPAMAMRAAMPVLTMILVMNVSPEMSLPPVRGLQPLWSIASERDPKQSFSRGSSAGKMQHHLAPVRPVAVLEEIDALPGAEQRAAAIDRNTKRNGRQRRIDVCRQSSGPSARCVTQAMDGASDGGASLAKNACR